jgi:hypothetical protein
MRQWTVIARRNFPIWTISRRIVDRRKLKGGMIRWVVETPRNVEQLPLSRDLILSIATAEQRVGRAA